MRIRRSFWQVILAPLESIHYQRFDIYFTQSIKKAPTDQRLGGDVFVEAII
jgi:hypothetical protein